MSSAYALYALRALLADPAPSVGVVVRITAGLVDVATVHGLVSATPAGALQPGQQVTLSRGVARARIQPSEAYPL